MFSHCSWYTYRQAESSIITILLEIKPNCPHGTEHDKLKCWCRKQQRRAWYIQLQYLEKRLLGSSSWVMRSCFFPSHQVAKLDQHKCLEMQWSPDPQSCFSGNVWETFIMLPFTTAEEFIPWRITWLDQFSERIGNRNTPEKILKDQASHKPFYTPSQFPLLTGQVHFGPKPQTPVSDMSPESCLLYAPFFHTPLIFSSMLFP